MIRKAELEDFNGLCPDTETSVRILCMVDAYGTEQSFMRFWSIEESQRCVGYLSLLDGTATLAAGKVRAFTDAAMGELSAFLFMQTEIQTIHTEAETGRRIFEYGNWNMKITTVMKAGKIEKQIKVPDTLTPREVYPLLTECFGSEMPPFSPWYVDVSHRVRHGCCRIVGIRENDEPVACAMTTAECGGAAIIGAVATIPEKRRKGYASALVLSLTQDLTGEGRTVYLLPKNETAHKLYSAIGFYDCGYWANLFRRTV